MPRKNFRVELAVTAIMLAGIVISFLNATGMTTGSAYKIAFITAGQEPVGSEKSVLDVLSEKYFVAQMQLSDTAAVDDYDLVIVSRHAGDMAGKEMCRIILSGKATLFLSGSFAIECGLSAGGSTAPYMPWKAVSIKNYPTEKYSGVITPYITPESIPAVVISEGDTALVKRNINDAYMLAHKSGALFFSAPQGSFAFTEDGKSIFLAAVKWLVEK